MNKFNERSIIIFMAAMIFIADISILLNISYIRQIIWFAILTTLPGLLILRILKLNKLEFAAKLVLSIGLSISFLLLFGLFINNFLLMVGYQTPLSTIALVISFNIAFIILAAIAYYKRKNCTILLPGMYLSLLEKMCLIVPILFISLSVFGVYFMNTTGNNIILMALLFLIPIYVTYVCYLNRKFPEWIYPVVIFFISISLVLMFILRSNHIIGVDRHSEYYFFLNVLHNQRWIATNSLIGACLSVTLLPTVYQSILNINEEFLYIILIPIIISFLPLITYSLSKKYLGEVYAFLATFFFISQYLFSFPGGRTQVAILFFALSVLICFTDGVSMQIRKLLLIIFMASCLVSHYSSTYLFFFIIFLSFFLLKALSINHDFRKALAVNNFRPMSTISIIVLFFIMIFFWYSQVTEVAFMTGITFIKETLISFQDLFISESRSETMQTFIGVSTEETPISSNIELFLTKITFFFIAVGVIATIKGYKETVMFSANKLSRYDLLKNRFEIEYIVIILVSVGILVFTLAVPFVSVGYDMNRIYNQVVIILSPLFVLGGKVLAKYINISPYILILIVLIPYFLCIFGPIHNIFGNHRAITLNSDGKFYSMYFIHEQDCYGSKFLKFYGSGQRKVYTDDYARPIFISQAGFRPYSRLFFSIPKDKIIDGYIFLRYYNIFNNKLIVHDQNMKLKDNVEYNYIFAEKNYIYNCGGSAIYI